MSLADRIARCRTPLLVQHRATGEIVQLDGPAEHARAVAECPIRFALADELTRLATALAYSRGTRHLDCADLLRVPAERLWVEWCEQPLQRELQGYGFAPATTCGSALAGRRGVLIRASADGRSGTLRTFWSMDDSEHGVLASSMEAWFDLDTAEGESPAASGRPAIAVCDSLAQADMLSRCFRFGFERSWQAYYDRAALSALERRAIVHHALGTIALDVPVLLAFLLLLATRSSLPQRDRRFERLNRRRARECKPPLLDYIEVTSPLPLYGPPGPWTAHGGPLRRHARLHHVRGHLVRRGNAVFWRVPHLRGDARAGTIRSRTVTWTFDEPAASRLTAVNEPSVRSTH